MREKYPALHIADTIDTQESPALAYSRTAELLHAHPEVDALFITCGIAIYDTGISRLQNDYITVNLGL